MVFPNHRDKRAIGVEFTSDQVSCPGADSSSSILRASKLVVVSAGAFGSPAILERSGIGAEAVLKRCGVEQLVELPGVGENYRGSVPSYVISLTQDYQITMAFLFHTLLQTKLLPWIPSGGGRRVLYRVGVFSVLIFPAHFNCLNVGNLAQWKGDGKSLIAQKLAYTGYSCR